MCAITLTILTEQQSSSSTTTATITITIKYFPQQQAFDDDAVVGAECGEGVAGA